LSKTLKIQFLFLSAIPHNWSFFTIFKQTFWSILGYHTTLRSHQIEDRPNKAKVLFFSRALFSPPFKKEIPCIALPLVLSQKKKQNKTKTFRSIFGNTRARETITGLLMLPVLFFASRN